MSIVQPERKFALCSRDPGMFYYHAAASRPRLSETVPKLFGFETSCYAFCGRYCIESVASQNKREYCLKCFTVSN